MKEYLIVVDGQRMYLPAWLGNRVVRTIFAIAERRCDDYVELWLGMDMLDTAYQGDF